MGERFREARRQSRWAIVMGTGIYLWNLIRQFWFVILVLVVGGRMRTDESILTFGIVFAVVVLGRSALRYFYFTFHLTDTSLVVHEGWWQKTRKTIPLERIQAVHLEQNLFHRTTGTTKVLIETAGSSGTEMDIQALSMEDAIRLREVMLSARKEVVPDIVHAPIQEDTTLSTEEKLFALSGWDLIKIGLSENHLRTVGIFLLVILSSIDDFREQSGLLTDSVFAQMSNFMFSYVVLLGLVLLIGTGVMISSVVRIIVRHADFSMWFDGNRFRINGGLLTIKESLIARPKLQYLQWTSNLLQRFFGIQRLEMAQAIPEALDQQSKVILPGIYKNQLDKILGHVFPTEKMNGGTWGGVDHRLTWWRMFVYGILPGMLLAGFFKWAEADLMALAAVWIIIVCMIQWPWVRRWAWFVNDDVLYIEKGWLQQQRTLMPVYKIQKVIIHQSPITKWLGLETIIISTAADDLRIPWITHEQAQHLRNWCLYCIERDDRPWM